MHALWCGGVVGVCFFFFFSGNKKGRFLAS